MGLESSKTRKKSKLSLQWLMGIAGGFLVWAYLHLLFGSCKKSFFGNEVYESLVKKHNGMVLSCSWHRSIFYTIFFFRNIKATIMASKSRDGDLVTHVLNRFGYIAPRGSSGKGKGGKEALELFIDYISLGHVGGLALDAPKGPPYISKHGILYAAAQTGAPIIPHIWFAEKNIRISSWDRSIVPKLFSDFVMIFDREPIYIPADATKEEIEAFRVQLDTSMLKLTYQADNWFKLRDRYNDPRDIPVPEPVPTPYHPPREKRE